VSTKRSWGAVGLGSDDMPGALFLILYRSKNNRDNVTFSPRLAYGNYEPKYYPDLKFEVLDGTGVKDGYMMFNAVCNEHCRSWPAGGTSKGYIDVSSPNQQAVYALGPKESFSDDEPDANLKMHSEYGTFTIDMKRTQGRADLPVLTEDSVAEGTTLNSHSTGKFDWKAAAHAAFMVFSFMLLLPIGAILIRTEKLAKFHKFNQTFALGLVLGGFAFGILASFHYQRVSIHIGHSSISRLFTDIITTSSPAAFTRFTRSLASSSFSSCLSNWPWAFCIISSGERPRSPQRLARFTSGTAELS
jgi:hypothetical protein